MNRFILKVSIIVFSLTLASFRWPVENGRITSTFGESRGDHFHDGIDLGSPDGKIYPVANGKLLLYWDKSLFPLDQYPGGGNYKIIAHEGGVYSVILHLEDGGPIAKEYGANDVIGIIGNTGHSYGKHLHLSIVDLKRRQSLNPLVIMPPSEDLKAPEVVALHLRIGDKYVQLRDKAKIRLTRHYPLLVEMYDSVRGGERLGVYGVVVHFNGKKMCDSVYKSIAITPNGMAVGGKTYEALYDEKGYYKVNGVKYLNGENIIKITAMDYAGNIAEKEFTVFVTLDMPL